MEYSKGFSLSDMDLASSVLKRKIKDCFDENIGEEDFPNIIRDVLSKEFILFCNMFCSVPDEIKFSAERFEYFFRFGEIRQELLIYQDTLNVKRLTICG